MGGDDEILVGSEGVPEDDLGKLEVWQRRWAWSDRKLESKKSIDGLEEEQVVKEKGKEVLPANPVRGYFHVIVAKLAAPDPSHYGLNFLFQGVGHVRLAFVVLVDGRRGYALV